MYCFHTAEVSPYLEHRVALALPVVAASHHAIIAAMSDAFPPRPPVRPLSPLKMTPQAEPKTLCERCGEEMYRMHAVWRCPRCGFKTDCCGW